MRVGRRDDGDGERPPLGEWLDALAAEREIVIQRLRQLDKVLVKNGRLRRETLPKRNR